MIRALHRWPGLLALVLVTLLALSGAALSVFPVVERLSVPQTVSGQTVADLAARVAANHPGLEQIRRAPSGKITAWWFEAGTPGSAAVSYTHLDVYKRQAAPRTVSSSISRIRMAGSGSFDIDGLSQSCSHAGLT